MAEWERGRPDGLWLRLVRILAAGTGTLPEHLLAFLPRDRAAIDHLGEEKIRDRLDLALLQCRGRRRGGALRPEFRLGHAIATLVRVGELARAGYRGPGAPRHRALRW